VATKKLKINFKMPTPTAAERLHAQQQKNRKAAGLPDPSEYKKKLDSMKSENYEEDGGPLSQEQLDEISAQLKASYVSGAKKQIKQSMPFTKKTDEYRDIAKNFIAKRQKGIAKANEEVEQLDEYESKDGVYKHTAKYVPTDRNEVTYREPHTAGRKLNKSRTSDADRSLGVKWGNGALYKAQSKKTLMNVHKDLPEEVEQLDEMPESSMKTRDVHSHLKKSGWELARSKGGHDVYKHPKAKHSIPVPRHNQLKAPLIRGIMKASKVEESFRIGGMATGGRGNIHMYDRNPGPKDGSELENVPFHAKTEKQKKLQNALTDLGKKMKEIHPKLREAKDSQEYDYEGDMAKSDLRSIMHHAKELHDMIEDTTNLAEWCQSKITLAEDYLSTVANYMRSEMNEETIEEDKNDYQRKIEKNNKNFIAASKRQKNPLTNVHTAQTKQKPVKEDVELDEEVKDEYSRKVDQYLKKKHGSGDSKKKLPQGADFAAQRRKERLAKSGRMDEGRASQRHPLEGHEYHKKSNEALVHIAKDAHAAAEAMKSHNTDAENKYRDQANDSATVRHFRKTSGMPDWYKKKYGHVKEEVVPKDSKDDHFAKQSQKMRDAINNHLRKGHSYENASKLAKQNVKEEVEQLDEKKNLPGLWANIRAKKARGESPAKPGEKDYPEDLESVRSGGKKSVKESYDVPFNKPYNKDSGTTTDKSGAKHTPMSKARNLAQQALSRTSSKKADTKQQARNAFDGMFGGGNPANKLGIMKKESAAEPVEEGVATNRPQPNLPSMSSDQAVANAQNAVQREKKRLDLLKAKDKTSNYETQQRQKNTPIVNNNGSLSMKKESAAEPTEGEMKGKQGYSRKAQIVMNAAKGKKSDSPEKYQKDPELSSEIHKT